MNQLLNLLCGLLWLAVAAFTWYYARQIRVVDSAGGHDVPFAKAPISLKLYLLILVLLLLAPLMLTGWLLIPQRFPPAVRLTAAPALLLLVFAGFYLWLRWKWCHLSQLFSGDPESALMNIRNEIETKGRTGRRLHSLGLAHSALKDWPEALAAFTEAEQLGITDPVSRANRALALWKSGRPGEALPIFAEVRETAPREVVIAMNYCQLLAELGRWDEAREQWQAAEKLYAGDSMQSAENRAVIEPELERCRALFREDA